MTFTNPPATTNPHIESSIEDAILYCECGQPIEPMTGTGTIEDGDEFACNNCGRTYALQFRRTQDTTTERPDCPACDTQLEAVPFGREHRIQCGECDYTISEVHDETELRRQYLIEQVRRYTKSKLQSLSLPVWQIQGDADALSTVIDTDSDVECPPPDDWLETQFEALKETDLITKNELLAKHATEE